MLNKPITVYAIKTDKDDYRSSYDEIFDTLEDAIDASFNYADWYTSRGTCTIEKILIGCGALYRVEESWRLDKGNIFEHKNEQIKEIIDERS